MRSKYYRVTLKAHPNQNGSYIRQEGGQIEVMAGEGSAEDMGARVVRGILVVDSQFHARQITKQQAEEARADFREYRDLQAYVELG